MTPIDIRHICLRDGYEVMLSCFLISFITKKEITFLVTPELEAKYDEIFTSLNSILVFEKNADSDGLNYKLSILESKSGSYKIKLSAKLNKELSATPLLYILILYAAFGDKRVRFIVNGLFLGLEEELSLSYLEEAILPLLRNIVEVRIQYPELNFRETSECSVICQPSFEASIDQKLNTIKEISKKLIPITKVLKFACLSTASENLKPRQVVERQVTGLRQGLSGEYDLQKPKKRYVKSIEPGSEIAVWSVTDEQSQHAPFYVSEVGERSKPAEIVGQDAAFCLQEKVESGYLLSTKEVFFCLPLLCFFGGEFRCQVAEPVEMLVNLYKSYINDSLNIAQDRVSCH